MLRCIPIWVSVSAMHDGLVSFSWKMLHDTDQGAVNHFCVWGCTVCCAFETACKPLYRSTGNAVRLIVNSTLTGNNLSDQYSLSGMDAMIVQGHVN